MKHFSAKRWLSLLLITSILAWLLVYLVACTQTGGGVRTLSAEPQETVADIDLTATQAAKTIEAVLQTSAAVTPMPVATPTPPPPPPVSSQQRRMSPLRHQQCQPSRQ